MPHAVTMKHVSAAVDSLSLIAMNLTRHSNECKLQHKIDHDAPSNGEISDKYEYVQDMKERVRNKIIHPLPGITIFGHSWRDSPMIFTRDFVTRENHCQIASLVTQKSLFTVTHALFLISLTLPDSKAVLHHSVHIIQVILANIQSTISVPNSWYIKAVHNFWKCRICSWI